MCSENLKLVCLFSPSFPDASLYFVRKDKFLNALAVVSEDRFCLLIVLLLVLVSMGK